MRRLRTILAFAPVTLCLFLWVGSYWRFSIVQRESASGRVVAAISDRGAFYAGWVSAGPYRPVAPSWYFEVDRNPRARIENEFGLNAQGWKPARYFTGGGGGIHIVVVQWWFLALVCAAAAALYWRRQRRQRPEPGWGFAVEPAGVSRP